jgi:hypothetical protein
VVRVASLTFVILGAWGTSVRAQVPALPRYGGGFTDGVAVAATAGFPGENSRTGDVAIVPGATVTWAAGRIGLSGALAGVSPAPAVPDTVAVGWRTSWGVEAGLRLLGGALDVFELYLSAGAGGIGEDHTGRRETVFPLGASALLKIPTPLLSIRPWLAPRVDFTQVTQGGETVGENVLAFAAGIDLAMLNGLSFRVLYDKVEGLDGVAGIGLAFHF